MNGQLLIVSKIRSILQYIAQIQIATHYINKFKLVIEAGKALRSEQNNHHSIQIRQLNNEWESQTEKTGKYPNFFIALLQIADRAE